jgi:hypothetical protein
MATSVAAAITLVLSASLPALANHAEPDATLDGDVNSCAGIVEGVYWEDSADVPDLIGHPWWIVAISADYKWLDVTLTPQAVDADAQIAVLVKGGDNTNVFLGEPGESLTALFAPVNASGDHADISSYTICKVKAGAIVPPPHDEEPPPGGGEDETPPDDDETPPDDGEGGGEPTPTPTPSKTPVAIPTSIPAGTADSGPWFETPLVAVIVIAVLAAGAAVLGRRFAA